MSFQKRKLALVVALAGSTVPALGQSIATLPPNNGSGGVFLQLTPTASTLTVESFASYFSSVAGTPVSVEVWVRPGAYAGFTASNVGWTLSETVIGTSAGTTTLSSNINLANPIAIPAGGPTSIYLHAVTVGGGIRYQGTGTTSTTTFVNADVTLFSDVSRTGAASFLGTQFTPRAFAGTINYSIGGVTGRCCRTDGTCIVTSAANCSNQGGTYGGDGTNCSPNPCPQPPSGACCFEAGTCSVLTAANCATQGGAYSGDGTDCSTANCPQPGACCLPDGSCVILTSAKCTSATTGGTYRGDGTTCGAVNPRCWSSPTLWKNGPISTGATAQSGLAAPVGATWSEVANNTGQTTVANTTAGYSALAPIRNADNFTIRYRWLAGRQGCPLLLPDRFHNGPNHHRRHPPDLEWPTRRCRLLRRLWRHRHQSHVLRRLQQCLPLFQLHRSGRLRRRPDYSGQHPAHHARRARRQHHPSPGHILAGLEHLRLPCLRPVVWSDHDPWPARRLARQQRPPVQRRMG